MNHYGSVTYTYGEVSGTYLVGTATTTLPVDSYYLRIRTEDDAAASSAWYTASGIAFNVIEAADITPPVISSVSVASLSTSTATITWSTNESADSRVDYGVTSSYGTASTSVSLTSSHSVNIYGLAPSTLYHYRVQSTDAALNIATSSDLTFTTDSLPDVTAPGISSISVDPESTYATIYWITDEAASSIIEYGPSSSYVASTTEANISPRVTSHEIVIPNLESCVTYHYRIISRDASNNEVVSNDNNFTTKDCAGDAVVTSQTANEMATSTGGTVNLKSSGLGISLSIPPLFATSSAHFQIKKIDDNTARTSIGIPAGTAPAGSYTYELHAVTDDFQIVEIFDEPITITLTYGPSDVNGIVESSLRIYRWHNSAWEALSDCVVDTIIKTVTCSTEHFSTFGLFGDEEETGEATTDTTPSRRSSGTTVVSRAMNLLDMGNTKLAQELINQYPDAFSNQTNVATVVAVDAPAVPSSSDKCVLRNVTKTLRAGSEGEEVRLLQKFLNCTGFFVATSGPGSVGNETNIFSNRTYNALVKFQEHYAADILIPIGLTKGTGIFGEMSNKKAQSFANNMHGKLND